MNDPALVSISAQGDSQQSLALARSMPADLQAMLNEQFMRELESSYLYLSLANYFTAIGLNGFAHWMRAQAKEEQEHGMKIFNFMHDRGVDVELAAISKPVSEFSSPVDALEQSLAQERLNTLSFKSIYGAAQRAEEFDLVTFTHWFLGEQVEEENSIIQMITDLKRGNADTSTILFLDRELSRR